MPEVNAGRESAEELSRAYRGILEQQAWEADPPLTAADHKGETAPAGVTWEQLPPAASEPPSHIKIIEALLFVGGAPLSFEEASRLIRGLTLAHFQEAIDSLNQCYRAQGRPYAIIRQEPGYALGLRPRFQRYHERLYGGVRAARLSPPAVETLAVVAYRQPVTKQEVDSLRGHESRALLRQLVRRGLIAVAARGESGGRDLTYATTERFLKLFGLGGLEDLPETEELQRL
jgi:segregation and condensation protein B